MIDYSGIPLHMQDGARLYIEDGVQSGDFLMAVFRNDFADAVQRADMVNFAHLKDWAGWLYMDPPRDCWGSAEKVEAWLAKGGLNGKPTPKGETNDL